MRQENATEDSAMPIYQIRLQGHLGPQWTAWFADLTLTLEAGGVSVLTGPIADQAALYGLLRQIHKVGLPLLSVTQIAEEDGLYLGE
jgi:hypothetical protein